MCKARHRCYLLLWACGLLPCPALTDNWKDAAGLLLPMCFAVHQVCAANHTYFIWDLHACMHAQCLGLWDASRSCAGWRELMQQADSKGSTRSRMGQDIRFQDPLYHPAVKFPIENYTPEINIRRWLGYLTAVGNTAAGINNTNDFLVSSINFM